MRLQIIQDGNGKDTGVFIPINDWLTIKESYPDIEEAGKELPKWEKDLIEQRLKAISDNPERLMQGNMLLDELKRKA